MRLAIVGTTALLVGCAGTPRVYDPGPFRTYVERFLADARSVGRPVKVWSLVVKFGDLSVNPSRVGVCQTGGDTPNTVIIDAKHWPTLSEAERRGLMYHELGHCVLRRGHTGVFHSFMYAYVHSDIFIKAFYSELVQELFHGERPGSAYTEQQTNYYLTVDGCEQEEESDHGHHL